MSIFDDNLQMLIGKKLKHVRVTDTAIMPVELTLQEDGSIRCVVFWLNIAGSKPQLITSITDDVVIKPDEKENWRFYVG